MHRFGNYNQYFQVLKNEIGREDNNNGNIINIIFSGEWSVLKVIEKYSPEGDFFVWDMLDNDSSILIMACQVQDFYRITKAYQLDFSIGKLAKEVCISESSIQSAIRWWNMCFYRNNEGIVLFDDSYHQLYASSDTELKMEDFCDCLQRNLETVPNEIDGCKVYLLGDFAFSNPIIYALQSKGCQVTPITSDAFQESQETEERLLRLKERMVRPVYHNGVFASLIAADGITPIPAKCGHVYVISLPCENLDLDAKVFGDYPLKEILPNGEVRRDYRCCGNEFMYLEQTLYSDMFGNTFLKSINSGESNNQKTTVLNEFAFNY